MCLIGFIICLHVFPEEYEISFIDNPNKKVRTLELGPFQEYLKVEEGQGKKKKAKPIIKLNSNYTTVQQKQDKTEEGYSFYTMLSDEIVSAKQLFWTVILGVFISLVIYIESILKDVIRNTQNTCSQIGLVIPRASKSFIINIKMLYTFCSPVLMLLVTLIICYNIYQIKKMENIEMDTYCYY